MLPEINRLIELLEDGAQMLSKYEINMKPEEKWSIELFRLAEELKHINTTEALRNFLQRNHEMLFGVKDTFRELWIDPENGHVAVDFRSANRELNLFRKLLFKTWNSASV